MTAILAAAFCLVVWLLPVRSVIAAEPAHAPAAGAAKVAHAAPAHASHAHEPPGMVRKFAYSYLAAYMFFLSLCLGSWFLVNLHHLFDAMWLVPVRRMLEHMACMLFPWMAILFIPIALLANEIYPWMRVTDVHADHALAVKTVLFNKPAFYLVSVALFLIWWFFTHSLRRNSLEQDKTGAAICTIRNRRLAAGGMIVFALTTTLAAIYWMKSLEYQWFSTMYGVYYFAGSVWTTLATLYLAALYFTDKGTLKDVTSRRMFYDNGVLLFAFTVFYSYIHFSQYFLIWHAALPEETFWYIKREQGTWKQVGFLILFGHFFVPFLLQLRIDWKLNRRVIVPVCVWAWLMHYVDMQFNTMPVIYPEGISLGIFDVACVAGIGWFLVNRFLSVFYAHPPYPQRDPRIAETMGVYVRPLSEQAVSHGGGK
jgi:hypothetical protein